MLETIIGGILSLIALGIGIYIFLYPAFKAEDKGSSFWGFFLLCFIAWHIPLAFGVASIRPSLLSAYFINT